MSRSPTACVIAFLAGLVIMVLEIVGARFLGSKFGGAFYVWVSQIGVVMFALAIGYYIGGLIADMYGSIRIMGWLLVVTGIFTALIPDYANRLIDMIVMRHPAGKQIPLFWQRVDPAIGSASIFLLPCLVLAMICPFMIRLATRKVSEVGRTSGIIYAASTVGSIMGVICSGYLINYMHLSTIFRLTGLLIGLMGVVCIMKGRVDIESNE